MIHDACIRIDRIPNLASLLIYPLNVWKISLGPMDETCLHPHLIRLFPHGAVILLTDSLILRRPREALRILKWFRLLVKTTKTPGTWKLAARHHLCLWLLDILNICGNSDAGVFENEKQVFADIYANLMWILEGERPLDSIQYSVWCSMDLTGDDVRPLSDDALLVEPASLHGMQDLLKDWRTGFSDNDIRLNDDILIQWFAEWAVFASERFRKFQVVLGYEPGATLDGIVRGHEKTWGHIKVRGPEKFYGSNQVPSPADLDIRESDRVAAYARMRASRKRRRVLSPTDIARKKMLAQRALSNGVEYVSSNESTSADEQARQLDEERVNQGKGKAKQWILNGHWVPGVKLDDDDEDDGQPDMQDCRHVDRMDIIDDGEGQENLDGETMDTTSEGKAELPPEGGREGGREEERAAMQEENATATATVRVESLFANSGA